MPCQRCPLELVRFSSLRETGSSIAQALSARQSARPTKVAGHVGRAHRVPSVLCSYRDGGWLRGIPA